MAPNSLWPAAGAWFICFLSDGRRDRQRRGRISERSRRDCGACGPDRVGAVHGTSAAPLAVSGHGRLERDRRRDRSPKWSASCSACSSDCYGGLVDGAPTMARYVGYSLVGVAIAAAVLGMFVLSYLATGLASDQPLDLMLRFADPARLDHWGVIPQIIAWRGSGTIIRHWEAVRTGRVQGSRVGMRLGVLWPFLAGPAHRRACAQDDGRVGAVAGSRCPPDALGGSFAGATAGVLPGSPCSLVALRWAGRNQSRSFAGSATFFIPSMEMFGVAGSVWGLSWPLARRDPLYSARRARGIACRQSGRLAVSTSIGVGAASGDGECRTFLRRLVQPGGSVFPRQQPLCIWRDQSRRARRRATGAVSARRSGAPMSTLIAWRRGA